MKLLKLLLQFMSKTASFFNIKFLAIMKILLPGRLYSIFISLFPIFKLLYRYGKNIHSMIGILFLANILDFSFNLGIIYNNLLKVFNIGFNLFTNLLQKFTNLTISKKFQDIYPNNKISNNTNQIEISNKPNQIESSNIIEKSNNKITEFKKTYSNDINNNNQESLREFYKHDLENLDNKTFWQKHKWHIIIGVSTIISICITYYYWDYFSGLFPKKPDTKLNDEEKLAPNVFNNPKRAKRYALEHDLQFDDETGRILKYPNGEFVENPKDISLDDPRLHLEYLETPADKSISAKNSSNLETPVDKSISSPTNSSPSSSTSSSGTVTPTNNNNSSTGSNPSSSNPVRIDYKDPWAIENNRDPVTQKEYEKYFGKPEDIKGKGKSK